MDPRERVLDIEETFRMAFEGMISGVWCALPAVITAVTNGGNTLEVQPTVNGRVRQTDGTYKSIQMPKLLDCPVVWPTGGGCTFTFPVTVNVDECLVVLASRCIEQWWYSGFAFPQGQTGADGNPINFLNNPPQFRMHDLSDGFAIMGVRSLPRKLASVSTTTARLRTDDNTCFFDFDPVNKKMQATFPGGINLNGVTIDSSGNMAGLASVSSSGNISSTAGAVNAKTQVAVNGTPLTVP